MTPAGGGAAGGSPGSGGRCRGGPGKRLRRAAWIACLALAVRLAGLALFPGGVRDSDDLEMRYRPIAESLLAGEGFSIGGRPTALAPPGYPLFIAACTAVFGRGAGALRLPLVAVDVLGVLLVWLMAGRVLGPRRGLAAGLAAALCPYTVWTTALAASDTLFLAVHAAFLLAFVVLVERPTVARGAAAGALLGAATLVRAVSLLLPAVLLPVWLAGRRRRPGAVRAAAVLLLGFAAVLAPWMVRNTLRFHRFVPVQTLGGYHLYMATFADEDPSFREGKRRIQAAAGSWEEAEGRFLKSALARVRSHPAEFLRLAVARQVDMWSRTSSGRFEGALLLANGLLLAAALAGWLRAGEEQGRLVPLVAVAAYYVGLHTALFALFRYMLPVIPILIVLAAAGLPESRVQKSDTIIG